MSKPSLYPRLAVSVSTPGRRCSHACSSLYPRLAVAVSTPFRRCTHALPSLYPCLAVAVSTLCISFFFIKNANPRNSDGDAIPATGRLGKVPRHVIAIATFCIGFFFLNIQRRPVRICRNFSQYLCSVHIQYR